MVKTGASASALVAYCKNFTENNVSGETVQPNDFWHDWPVEKLLGTMPELNNDDIKVVVGVLRKLLSQPHGVFWEEGTSQGVDIFLKPTSSGGTGVTYLKAACRSPVSDLRRLSVELLGRVVLAGAQGQAGGVAAGAPPASEHTTGPTEEALHQLIQMLTDSDTGVGLEAETALAAWARHGGPDAARALLSPTQPLGSIIHVLAADKPAAVQSADQGRPAAAPPAYADAGVIEARVLGMALFVAAEAGDDGPAVLRESGLLQPVLSSLASAQEDPLSAMSCLAQLQEITSPAPPSASANGNGNGGSLNSPTLSPAACTLPAALHDELLPLLSPCLHDPLLGPSALTVTAALLRAVCDKQAGGGSGSCASPQQPWCEHPLLQTAKDALDQALDAPAEAEGAAMDAVGVLGLSRAGAQVALTAPGVGGVITGAIMTRALINAPTPALRISALHAAASLAGAERMHEGARSLAILSQDAELVLRESLYNACAGTSMHTPAEALLAVLSAPLPEQRVAVYRFMGAMAVRPWFAAEVVRHVQLLTHVTTAASEATTTVVAGSLDARTHAKSALWRHAAVEALFLTAEAAAVDTTSSGASPEGAALAATLRAAVPALRKSLEAGPHGSHARGAVPRGAREHWVATEMR